MIWLYSCKNRSVFLSGLQIKEAMQSKLKFVIFETKIYVVDAQKNPLNASPNKYVYHMMLCSGVI